VPVVFLWAASRVTAPAGLLLSPDETFFLLKNDYFCMDFVLSRRTPQPVFRNAVRKEQQS